MSSQRDSTLTFVSSFSKCRSRTTFLTQFTNKKCVKPSTLFITQPSRTTIICSVKPNLKARIASVQTAEKIVSALRLVAAARIRASSHEALRTRPFADEVQRMIAALVKLIKQRQIPVEKIAYSTAGLTFSSDAMLNQDAYDALLDRMYLALLSSSPRNQNVNSTIVITVVTSDRGFCGSYNRDVLKKASSRIRQLQTNGSQVELVLVGRVAQNFFRNHYSHIPIRNQFLLGRIQNAKETAISLSNILLKDFVGGEADRMEIVYTRFLSLIASSPSARTLLPLTPSGIESVGDELFEMKLTTSNGRLTAKRERRPYIEGELTYDISDDEAILLLNSMLPMYVTSQLTRMINEAIAAEQCCRLAAMSAASDNAKSLGTLLKSQYNRQRQEKITSEIIEVLSNVQHT